MNKMDATEQIAYFHLVSLGYDRIAYEPDGNVPPDFVINNKIAVEVRRLNQNERDREYPRGLEEVELPLLGKLQNLLASFGEASTVAWWVFFRFKRPVPSWKKIEVDIRDFFRSLADRPPARKASTWIGYNFQVEIWPKAIPTDSTFELGGFDDLDQGGFVIPKVEHNLRFCIAEKTTKVEAHRQKYPEWWLILIDHVAYGMSEFDRNIFREAVKINHNWDRITLVSPLDPTNSFNI